MRPGIPPPAILLTNLHLKNKIEKIENSFVKIFLTGRPGIGKSTILIKIIEELKRNEKNVCGFVTPEVRENGRRIGFKVLDISTNKSIWFARVDVYPNSTKFGKYSVFIKQFEKFLDEVFKTKEDCDIIVIDEIGKMEMLSEKFRKLIFEFMGTSAKTVCVLHRGFVKQFKKFGKVFEVTFSNRNNLSQKILNFLI